MLQFYIKAMESEGASQTAIVMTENLLHNQFHSIHRKQRTIGGVDIVRVKKYIPAKPIQTRRITTSNFLTTIHLNNIYCSIQVQSFIFEVWVEY
jgi:hypothetical protein